MFSTASQYLFLVIKVEYTEIQMWLLHLYESFVTIYIIPSNISDKGKCNTELYTITNYQKLAKVIFYCIDQRIPSMSTFVKEIVSVDGPDHGSS